MRFTETLLKTKRETASQTESVNADLLIRAGFVDQLMAGVYTYLPLGFKVLKKIENIVREEMEQIGGAELLMPALHPKKNWEQTGRWESLDDLFRFTSHYTKREFALAPTHEEVVAPLTKKFVFSYKDLPKYVFQIQTKFREERRAKAGLLRGREFLMKDLYSFHADQKDLDEYYEKAAVAYKAVYNRLGIGEKTYLTFASGGSFSKYSHEFQTETPSGEDTIYLCEKCRVAINKEIIEEQKECPDCKNKNLKEIRAIEVGNIFKLGTKYSEPFGLTYSDKDGKENPVVMGCYGIGISRLMGTIVEVSHDERGILWPKEVSPYDIHLVSLDDKLKEAEVIYEELTNAGYDVLWDDRAETAGVKLADADLIGVPVRIVVSDRSLKEGNIEVKERNKKEPRLIKFEDFLKEGSK